ncbi:hypothetical protein RMATCC62417_07705 [Rhizopus microsporus]|nr:hypothetical protein RMATCC62417_07705 [Rhizopus microsporus]
MTISRLNNDCLQLVFEACDGCPWTLRAISQVCRQWYSISRLPSVWRKLLIDRPMYHAAYVRLLTSKQPLLTAVTHLTVAKPNETRHAHFAPLPFEHLPSVTHLETRNLCLAEIAYLSHQLNRQQLVSIICHRIETWCDTKRFCFQLIYEHPQLKQAHLDFAEDGNSGFASILELADNTDQAPHMHQFTLTSIRDGRSIEQKSIISRIEEIENDSDEEYYPDDPEVIDRKRHALLQAWQDLEDIIVKKYSPLTKLKYLTRLEFGFCNSWTSKVWLECFFPLTSSRLQSLSLHGWDQLGKLGKIGCQSMTMQPIRLEAENAITTCLEAIPNLRYLQLVDFSIGLGLLKASSTALTSVDYLEIVFTKLFVRFFTEPADVWLLIGPLKEFVLNVFKEKKAKKRRVCICLHRQLVKEIEKNEFFKNESFFESMRECLEKNNVAVDYVLLPGR